jgi:hypothetical protein
LAIYGRAKVPAATNPAEPRRTERRVKCVISVSVPVRVAPVCRAHFALTE